MSWRPATEKDDHAIVEMCQALFQEDPSDHHVTPAQTLATLKELRRHPIRGRAVVLELNGKPEGYAFLVSWWSNELGGEKCILDELYIRPLHRGNGYGSGLVQLLIHGNTLWPAHKVAVELEVTPQNDRARALYAKLGFKPIKNSMMRIKV